MYQFKTKESEINRYVLCLQNISEDLSVDNMKKIGLSMFMVLVLIIKLLQMMIY